MKRVTLLVLLFSFSIAFAVMSADLGELAKKEKARREAIDKSGKKAKVFTNEDIGNLKSQLAMEGATAEGESTPVEETDSSYTPPQEGADYVPAPEPVQQPTNPAEDRQKQIRELEEQKEELEKQAKEAKDTVGSGGLWHSRNTGDQYKKAREAEEKLEKLDQKIDDARTRPSAQTPAPEQQPAPVEEYVPPEEQPVQEEPPADTTTSEEPPL
jgi:hypothetical protein